MTCVTSSAMLTNVADDFNSFVAGRRFNTILADPPWQFQNKTGKVAPEHKRLARYSTLKLDDIKALPVEDAAADTAHLYLWVPNALLPEGLAVVQAWGFRYKANIVWQKVRKDGGPDGRGVGFYFRNVTELLLFGVRGKNVRTLRRVGPRSTRSQPESASTVVSPTNSTRSSRAAVPDPIWKCLLVASVLVGRYGVIRRTEGTFPIGLPMPIIRSETRKRRRSSSRAPHRSSNRLRTVARSARRRS